MGPGTYVLLDGGLSFGVLVLFCVWQLISTDRARKRRIEREKAAREGKEEPRS
jgi:hypothetical protein